MSGSRLAGWALLLVLAVAFYPLDQAHVVEGWVGALLYVLGLGAGIRLAAPVTRSWFRYTGFGALVVAIEALIWSAEWFIIGGARPSFGFGLTWLALALTFGIPSVLLAVLLRLLPRHRVTPV